LSPVVSKLLKLAPNLKGCIW